MASAIATRPATDSTSASSSSVRRNPSFSSFPHSRSQSTHSVRNGKPGRSPNPQPVGQSDASSLSSKPRSQKSSISGPTLGPAESLRKRTKLRSQYPADSPENHVEYILVASFDIDRGSVMEHQYPGPISGDEHMLAELMLPDQAHVRSQDWTIFFLHKDSSAEDEAKEERRRGRRRKKIGDERGEENRQASGKGQESDKSPENGDADGNASGDSSNESSSEDEDSLEGPPLIYVLNLVNTKRRDAVRRGAIVKAMAICTRHSFLHIYKPLLLLALEEYFRLPQLETLAALYHAVNSMDLSLMPRLSSAERFLLQQTDSKDMFVEKFQELIQQRVAQEVDRLSLSPSRSGQRPRYVLPRDTHEFESRVIYNSIPIPVKVPTAISPEMVGDFSLIKLIQTFSGPHSSSPQPFSLHPHLTTSGAYTHPIIVLVNALLTQKRIIFLGHNRPSSEVAEVVLAACALASGGLLRGFTRHAFPYTDLTKIDDLLKVPGFIAGVTNPAFAHKPEWWDLLCDVSTGRMKISNCIEGAAAAEGLLFFQQQQPYLPAPAFGPGGLGTQMGLAASGGISLMSSGQDATGDNAFMEALLQSIANRHGENAIRSKWRDWISKFTRIAAAFEETVYGASALYIGASDTDAGVFGVSGHGYVWPDEVSRMRELAGNASRVEGWRTTRSYYSYVQDLARMWTKRPIKGLDFMHQHDRLSKLRLTHDQSAAIYLAFAAAVESGTRTGDEESSGGSGSPLDTATPGTAWPTAGTVVKADAERYSQYDIINQLLCVLPESNTGLFYISLGMFHPRADVRAATVGLLEKILEHAAGRHFWAGLGKFLKLAFFRLKREQESGGRT